MKGPVLPFDGLISGAAGAEQVLIACPSGQRIVLLHVGASSPEEIDDLGRVHEAGLEATGPYLGATKISRETKQIIPAVEIPLAANTDLVWSPLHGGVPEPSPGPKGHWKFNEATGLVAADDSGEGNDLDLVNFPGDDSQWVAGKINGALNFDGANDLTRNLAVSASLEGLTTLSVASWINAVSAGQGNLGRIFHKLNNTSGRPSILLADMSAGSCRLRVENNYTGNVGQWATTSREVALAAWVHIGVTYDMGLLANDPILYVNGVAKAITELSIPTGVLATDDDNLWVGNRSDGLRTFDGALDDTRAYDRILTPGEMLDLFDMGSVGGTVLQRISGEYYLEEV